MISLYGRTEPVIKKPPRVYIRQCSRCWGFTPRPTATGRPAAGGAGGKTIKKAARTAIRSIAQTAAARTDAPTASAFTPQMTQHARHVQQSKTESFRDSRRPDDRRSAKPRPTPSGPKLAVAPAEASTWRQTIPGPTSPAARWKTWTPTRRRTPNPQHNHNPRQVPRVAGQTHFSC
ncbi:hypothetical protein VTN31DRAFT_1224 [Thermomyces dupontii]|uniref:uncharacterized protein n=1 Tax=Talaromyces thermophilus TaxID=28565 RepID=UPI0037447789